MICGYNEGVNPKAGRTLGIVQYFPTLCVANLMKSRKEGQDKGKRSGQPSKWFKTLSRRSLKMGKGESGELELSSRLLVELRAHKSLLTQSQSGKVIPRGSQKVRSQSEMR